MYEENTRPAHTPARTRMSHYLRTGRKTGGFRPDSYKSHELCDLCGGAIYDLNIKSIRSERNARYRALFEAYQAAKRAGQTHKIWQIAGGITTRQSHKDANGQKVGIDEIFRVGGEALFLPNDPEASLSETANCRCSVKYVTIDNTESQNSGIALIAYERGRNSIILHEGGIEEVRSGGTRAWRNNNPGNLRNSAFSTAKGSLGEAGGFAVFASEQEGMSALIALLKTNIYQLLSLFSAISRYAPSSENNTANYQQFIEKITGLRGDTPLNSLSTSQLKQVAFAIRRIEGWQAGTVIWQKK